MPITTLQSLYKKQEVTKNTYLPKYIYEKTKKEVSRRESNLGPKRVIST